jgi:hypothetical protein
MGFNPGTGMTPNDWRESEARMAERMSRADNPYGREMSGRTRRVLTWVFSLAALAFILYAILAFLGIVTVPGINA